MNNMNTPNPSDFFNQKEIGGKRYNLIALNSWEALHGTTLLMTTLAPVFGEVLDSRNVDEEVAMFEKQNTFREILTIVANNLHKPDMMTLVQQMLNGVTCDGQSVNINTHFQGKVHEMMELIIFAMEVNFKGFFTQNDMFQSLMKGLGKVMTATDVE